MAPSVLEITTGYAVLAPGPGRSFWLLSTAWDAYLFFDLMFPFVVALIQRPRSCRVLRNTPFFLLHSATRYRSSSMCHCGRNCVRGAHARRGRAGVRKGTYVVLARLGKVAGRGGHPGEEGKARGENDSEFHVGDWLGGWWMLEEGRAIDGWKWM